MEANKFSKGVDAPIGVFDSGVGGISVLNALIKEMPQEDYWYFGDSKNAPYGTKTLEEVRELTFFHVERLIKQGAKAVVVACNTATSAAVRLLRERHPDYPIIGIEPAIKPAALLKDHPNIIVMATPMTIREEKFHNLMDKYSDKAHIIPLACPGLMDLIEKGFTEGNEVRDLLKKLLSPFDISKIDAVVLGCTHYPFVQKELRNILGEDIVLLEGGPGTAKETKRRLKELGLVKPEGIHGRITFDNSIKEPDKIHLYQKLLEL